MSWHLGCDKCTRGEEIFCIGLLARSGTCAVCGCVLPLHLNGVVDANPLTATQVERLKLARATNSGKGVA